VWPETTGRQRSWLLSQAALSFVKSYLVFSGLLALPVAVGAFSRGEGEAFSRVVHLAPQFKHFRRRRTRRPYLVVLRTSEGRPQNLQRTARHQLAGATFRDELRIRALTYGAYRIEIACLCSTARIDIFGAVSKDLLKGTGKAEKHQKTRSCRAQGMIPTPCQEVRRYLGTEPRQKKNRRCVTREVRQMSGYERCSPRCRSRV